MADWLHAFRLRTLPLALSSILLGSLLALWKAQFSMRVALAAIATTLFLQILSNLANDFGDFVNGVDNDNRVGPKRSLQSGNITKSQMKTAIAIFAVLAFVSGLWLLSEAFHRIGLQPTLLFFGFGLLAILAALGYTIGSKPYGYRGLGDLAVFLFFGIVGVSGTFFLHTNQLAPNELLPAIAIGLLATAVLNLNNMRDEVNDRNHGKHTLVVRLGYARAKIYHVALLAGAILASTAFVIMHYQSPYQFLFLVICPLIIQNMVTVMRNTRQSELDKELKKLAIGTLLFALLLGIGMNIV